MRPSLEEIYTELYEGVINVYLPADDTDLDR